MRLYAILCGWCGTVTGFAPVRGSTSICDRCLEQRYPESEAA